ncbi:hypothetical protein BDW60DRAFT_188793 [Aspergillus nidulans var. acristatus]
MLLWLLQLYPLAKVRRLGLALTPAFASAACTAISIDAPGPICLASPRCLGPVRLKGVVCSKYQKTCRPKVDFDFQS